MGTTPPSRQSGLPTPVSCPKCGFVQPKADECVQCGVLFAKAATVSKWADRPEMVPRSVTEKYAVRIGSPRVCLAPNMDHGVAEKALAPYITDQTVWERGEVYVFNENEEVLAVFDNCTGSVGVNSNLVLTNMKLLTSSGGEAPVCTGYDLFSIESVQLGGPNRDLLQIGKRAFQFSPMSPEDTEARTQFVYLLKEIVRGLKQADSLARDKARRTSRSGEGPQIGQWGMRERPTLPPGAVSVASIEGVRLTTDFEGAKPSSAGDGGGSSAQPAKPESAVGSVFKKFLRGNR